MKETTYIIHATQSDLEHWAAMRRIIRQELMHGGLSGDTGRVMESLLQTLSRLDILAEVDVQGEGSLSIASPSLMETRP